MKALEIRRLSLTTPNAITSILVRKGDLTDREPVLAT